MDSVRRFGVKVQRLMCSITKKQLDNSPSCAQAVVGAGMGCLMCYGLKIGWYHRVFLPVIVLELEDGAGSIWGAIDLCVLCMVAAGEWSSLYQPTHT